ncbi:MAG: endopeptidase La [Lachnospiraceae bacterium]|nr:endopeptidase La [Lachnospiraceae bacterium]
MIIKPAYNILLLPDVYYYFKKDFIAGGEDEEVVPGTEVLFLLRKNEPGNGDVTGDEFYPIGIVAEVGNGGDEDSFQLHTIERVDVTDIEVTDVMTAVATTRPDIDDLSDEEEKKIFSDLKSVLLKFVQSYQWGFFARNFITQRRNINDLACAVSEYLNLDPEEKYEILACDSRRERCEKIDRAIRDIIEVAKVSQEAEENHQENQQQIYREDALKKQISYLQKELDDMHPENVSDIRKFEKKIEEAGMNPEAKREAEKVLNRMRQEGKDSHEYGMLYDYLDFVTGLSWKAPEPAEIDLAKAVEILDEDHYGLKKVKKRIIQQLAVMALNRKQSGAILLFEGAPGTGKTSIGQSIARALGRSYVRISLGGIRDEAEIRGHRRTYVGAMPGRIMEGMKRSGASNPVMVLDEVDKLTRDYNGDPASALLEVLDPEQNSTFTDHYMNVPYDLSNVLFVCTANTTETIPEPLLNRMEVISFPGYTAVEKLQIAKKHLVPKAWETMGIAEDSLSVTDDALRKMIDEYTMEAGVRNLKKQIETLCREAAVRLVRDPQEQLAVTEENLTDYLGRKQRTHDRKLRERLPGIVTGLAWTSAGGEILFIETKLTKGKGNVLITGQLGDVMKESVQIALSLVKSIYPEESAVFEDHDLHVHVPEGAVPKDGPSAGITLTTALASLVTGKTVSPDTAMTGEVSLRGGVMPIGGLNEKLMAAQRAGITRVLIPQDNVEDLEDVAEEVRSKVEIVPVRTVKEVLDRVLEDSCENLFDESISYASVSDISE